MWTMNLLPICYFYGKSLDMRSTAKSSTPRMKSGVSTFRLPEVEAPLFRVQCYAVESHFRGSEYNSLTSAVFASVRPLKSAGNRLLLRNSLPLKMSADNMVVFRAQYKTCAVPPPPMLDLPTLDYPTLVKPT